MLKIDNQILSLLGLFLNFIFVQVIIFWIALLPLAKKDYQDTQQVSYAIKTYQAPSEMKLKKGQYKQGYLLKLIDQSNESVVFIVDCTPMITDHIVAKFCSIFFNQPVKALTIDLHERYNSSHIRISSKIKSVTYKDLNNTIHQANFWNTPYKSGVDLYKAKNKFIFFVFVDLIVLLLFYFITKRQKFELDLVPTSQDYLQKKIFNITQTIFKVIAIGNFIGVLIFITINL